MEINEVEIEKLTRAEALELIHEISCIICNSLANEDKELIIELMLLQNGIIE